MTDITHLIHTIQNLTPDELIQVQNAVEERRQSTPRVNDNDKKAMIEFFNDFFDHFWDGFSEEEVEVIIKDMNSEYIKPIETEILENNGRGQ